MKKRQIVLYIVVMLILFTTSVYATIETNLNIKHNITGGLTAGSEFEVTLYLDNLETDKNIKAVEGWIDYNKDILEPLTLSSVVTGEDGKVKLDENNNLSVTDGSKDTTDLNQGIIFNCNPDSKVKKGDCRLVINFDKPINKEIDLVTLKFKIKDGVSKGTYDDAIKYTLFTVFADDTQESKDLGDFNVDIIVNEKQDTSKNETNNEVNNETNNDVKNETNNETKNEVNNETNNETNNGVKNENTPAKPDTNTPNGNNGNGGNGGNGGSQTNNGNQKDDTVSPTNLPKTGFRYIIIPIVIMTIIGLIFYKKYSKYSKFDNK